jgi:LacI family transcriptional regulator
MSQRKKSNRVTVADVANLVGVSTMTVSRVVNRDPKVRPDTRERVEAAIAELNYAPNIAARSLANAEVRRICLLYGNPSSAYLGELLLGALEAASVASAHLIVERTDPELDPERLEECLGRDWDALIVPPPMSDIAGIRRLVAKHNFPAAFISSATEPGRANEVRIDDRLAAREMTAYLISKGHKKIGFIKGHPNQTVSKQRYLGYQDALKEMDLPVDKGLVAQGLFSYRSGEEAGAKLLSYDDRPTAIFASNDDMAAGVLAAAARHRLSVPNDLSVVGFDNSPIASTIWPKLTTMSQPVAEMAAKAVEFVLKNTEEQVAKPNQYHTIILPYELIQRESVLSVAPSVSG